MREYRRDVGRFLRGETARYPTAPEGYFDRQMEAELAAFGAAALAGRDPCLLERFPTDQVLRSRLVRGELHSGVPVIANWLSYLAAQKG
jgi:homoserine O-succinyltransferase